MPTDLQVFLNNTTPRVAFAEVPGPSKPLTLENVNQLGDNVYLTSNDDVTKDPNWIKGTRPDANGKTNGAVTAAVIVTDKGNGNVDAFYMYFYAYNYGGEVLGWDALNFGISFLHPLPFPFLIPSCRKPRRRLGARNGAFRRRRAASRMVLAARQRASLHLPDRREDVFGAARRVLRPRLACKLRDTRDARPHDPESQLARRRAGGLHGPRRVLGPAAIRVLLRIRCGEECVHAV